MFFNTWSFLSLTARLYGLALLTIVVLSGCTAPFSLNRPADKPAAPVVTIVPPKSAFDWPAERLRIETAVRRLNNITVHNDDNGFLRLRLPAAKGFAHNKAQPAAQLKKRLDPLPAILTDSEHTEIIVQGHTDSIGSEMYNLDLSIRRAQAIVDYLRNAGIALKRLQAKGLGETEPIANNKTPAGRAKNRRIEIIIRPFETGE